MSDQGAPTIDQQNASLAGILKAMGATACAEASGSINTPFGGSAVGASFGCEQIAALQNQMTSAQQQVACVLSETSSSAKTLTVQINKINLTIKGYNFNSIKIDQSNDANVTVATSLTAQQNSDISNVLQSSLSSFLSASEKSDVEAGSVPDGQKAIAQTISSSRNYNAATVASNAISEVLSNISQNNTINLTLDGTDPISQGAINNVGNFELTQENIINYQASAIVNAFYSTILKQTGVTAETASAQVDQSATATVPQYSFGGILLIGAIVLAVFIFKGGSSTAKITKFIVPIVFLLSIVLAIIFGKLKNTIATVICSVIAAFCGVLFYFSIKKSLFKPVDPKTGLLKTETAGAS